MTPTTVAFLVGAFFGACGGTLLALVLVTVRPDSPMDVDPYRDWS